MKKLLILLLIVGCATEPEDAVAPDTTAPRVVITYPANFSTLTETTTVTVDVADEGYWNWIIDGEIGVVKLLVDGIETYTDSIAPYQFVWDVCVQSTGTHTLMANADDGTGNQGQSDLLSFTIDANYDCADVCGGDAVSDECGVCDGAGAEQNYDCDGNCIIELDCGEKCGENVELWSECYNIKETTELDLSSSQIRDSIPPEIGNLTNLTILNLGYNYLSGEIPSEIGNLTNLTILNLQANKQISGEIPSEIGNLTNLTELHLYDNKLIGEIPSEIGNLTNLTILRLGSNQLTGEIPSEIGNLTNLVSLELDQNQLSGSIPSWIGNLSNLAYLGLGANQLTGEIPSEIGSLTNLFVLHLSGNQLTGEIPQSVCELIQSGIAYSIFENDDLINTCGD